ncbi:DUF7315 family membrane protein [Halosimplex marinum]|uniref:DUF7315 family membrane protein n=1 Tax=Halosimplex marinum TaxID=3396620 RepID=UPI003F57B3B4
MADPSRPGDPADATADGTDDTDSAVDADSDSIPDSASATDESTSGESGESEAAGEPSAAGDDPEGARAREVVVPDAVYKRVTVFSTLFAVAAVVVGFLLLDAATDRATAELSEVQPLVALAGVGLIVVGGATYAFSTRFRADGMGNAKDETDEISDNG